ncbi:MAG TPA: type II secretion system F family protein [Xanthobacteraceae bacterium]
MFWLAELMAGAIGYVGPSFYIDQRIKSRREEHRAGFPDFMDLLVVCADSGLSMEGSLERVGGELADTYPSLGANTHMTNLEIRAGRTMTEALEHFGDRLGLEEARSFATSSSNRPSSARASAMRCASTATTCATSGSRAPRRRATACRPSSRADDGVHLPGPVRGHPAVGHRPPVHAQILTGRDRAGGGNPSPASFHWNCTIFGVRQRFRAGEEILTIVA